MSTALGTPDSEDEPIGAILARMRRTKRITGARLAGIVGMSQPKISRIERGKSLPDPEDVRLIARALDADDDTIRALVDRAERSHDRMTDWRPTSVGWPSQQKTLADWESAATVVRNFEPALVPGLLQTSGYAKAVLQAFQRVAPLVAEDLTESALLAALSARVKRQEVLADQAKSFQLIIGEAALKPQTLSPVEMLAQINHIRDVAARNAKVSIMALADGVPASIPPLHGFFLYDDDLVLVDLYNTGLISRSRRDTESYRKVFDLLEEHATGIDPLLDKYEAIYIEMLQRARNSQPGIAAS